MHAPNPGPSGRWMFVASIACLALLAVAMLFGPAPATGAPAELRNAEDAAGVVIDFADRESQRRAAERMRGAPLAALTDANRDEADVGCFVFYGPATWAVGDTGATYVCWMRPEALAGVRQPDFGEQMCGAFGQEFDKLDGTVLYCRIKRA